MSVIVMVTGARGYGKTEVRRVFEQFGFILVDSETIYLKYGRLHPDKRINEMPEVQDLIFDEAKEEILDKAKVGNVVYESTGTNFRWFKLKEAVEKHHRVIICKVVSNPAIASNRMEKRGWERNYPSSQKITQDILTKSEKTPYDFLIKNNGSLDNLRNKASQVMEVVGHE